MCKVVFLGFLLLAAGWDFKEKEIPLWVFGLGVAAALFVWGVEYAVWGRIAFSPDLLPGLGIGAALLILSLVSREAVGLGDGVFFLVSGLYLNYQDIFALFFSGLVLCGIYCLVAGAVGIIRNRNVWKQSVPFLPFLVPLGIWMMINQGGY